MQFYTQHCLKESSIPIAGISGTANTSLSRWIYSCNCPLHWNVVLIQYCHMTTSRGCYAPCPGQKIPSLYLLWWTRTWRRLAACKHSIIAPHLALNIFGTFLEVYSTSWSTMFHILLSVPYNRKQGKNVENSLHVHLASSAVMPKAWDILSEKGMDFHCFSLEITETSSKSVT